KARSPFLTVSIVLRLPLGIYGSYYYTAPNNLNPTLALRGRYGSTAAGYLRLQRQAHNKRRAFSFFAFAQDRSPVCLHALFHNRQPQTCAFDRASIGGSIERLKQMRLIALRDADALIAHMNNDFIIGLSQFETNFAFSR